MDQAGSSWTPPLIIAVRSHLPSPESPFQEAQSIVDRWHILSDQRQSIHPAFAALGAQRLAQEPKPVTRLQKGEPLVFNKIIIGIQHVQFGKVIGIFFADGTVEYRHRITLEEVYNDQNLDSVSHLHQVGFSFADATPCLESIFSPTGCSLIQVVADRSLKWRHLRHTEGIIGDSNQDGTDDWRCPEKGELKLTTMNEQPSTQLQWRSWPS
jgi:mediator of RNA polymerase II transcription subunit 16, fungi type